MSFRSTLPDVNIPQCNLLSFLFPDGKNEDDTPLWIDAENPTRSLSASQALHLIKRFAVGLDKIGLPDQAPVMVVAQNQSHTPVVYLGAIGCKRIFTAANPSYTVSELVHQMKTARAAIVLADPSVLSKVQEAAAKSGCPRVYEFRGLEESTSNSTSWQSILASDQDAMNWRWDPMAGDSSKKTVAVNNFSSGTTGLP